MQGPYQSRGMELSTSMERLLIKFYVLHCDGNPLALKVNLADELDSAEDRIFSKLQLEESNLV